MSENMQVERFTIDNVIPTKTLQQMNKPKLIKEIERLEKHALQLDNALALVLDNLYNVKKAKQQQDTNKVFGEEQE
jgi:hypothetical protein